MFTIQVSTMALESTFTTGGWILDSFMSSLSPKMVEALIYTQNWLRSPYEGIWIRDYFYDLDTYEQIESSKIFTCLFIYF